MISSPLLGDHYSIARLCALALCVYFGWLLCSQLIGCDQSSVGLPAIPDDGEVSRSSHRYVTWDRFEVDRWTAAWIIQRFIDPQAEFDVVPFGDPIAESAGQPFDVPGADWKRTAHHSTSGLIRAEIAVEDPKLDALVDLVRQLELSAWRLEPGESPALIFQEQLHQCFESGPLSERNQAMFAYLDIVYESGRLTPTDAP